MEITVLWSDSAIVELQAVYDYLLSTANFKVAQKLVNSIVDKSILLSANKIEEPIVVIATLFDCRQNPKKLAGKRI
jgi:hypothetical protein